jgi:hypothetical protein
LGLLPQCFSSATLSDTWRSWTLQRPSAVPRRSTVYFVALAFHLIQLVQGIHGVIPGQRQFKLLSLLQFFR